MIRGIFFILLVVPSAYAAEPMRSRYSAECILKAVAPFIRAKITVPIPRVIYESEISVNEFRELSKANFMGYIPDSVMTLYAYEPNIIFLRDGTNNYQGDRNIEDSLAHELVHFIQVKIRGETSENDSSDSLESEAVAVQFWFRENFMKTAKSPCP